MQNAKSTLLYLPYRGVVVFPWFWGCSSGRGNTATPAPWLSCPPSSLLIHELVKSLLLKGAACSLYSLYGIEVLYWTVLHLTTLYSTFSVIHYIYMLWCYYLGQVWPFEVLLSGPSLFFTKHCLSKTL